MRSAIIGVLCLVAGLAGALAYSHYFGEGRQLAQVQVELATLQGEMAKTTVSSQQAHSENEVLAAQIVQLTNTKDDLKKQLEAAQGNGAPAAPSAFPNPFANPAMAGIVKDQMAHMNDEKFRMLMSRLHLTPEQAAKVKAAMDADSKRMEAVTAKVIAGQKIDPQSLAAEMKDVKTVDQTLEEIMTDDQKTAYKQMQADEKTSSAERIASSEMTQVAPLLQLSDTQKDQVESALYQVQLDSGNPDWIKNNAGDLSKDPLALQDAEEKAKEDALAKFLSPDQLATYRQQAQSQLQMQRTMMQKFMPQLQPGGAATAPATTPAPSGP
jgi:hypothetical protein